MNYYDGEYFLDWLVAGMMAHAVSIAHFEFYPRLVVPPQLARCRGIAPVIARYAAALPDLIVRSGLSLRGILHVQIDVIADVSHCWRSADGRWNGYVLFDVFVQCRRVNGALVADTRRIAWPMLGHGARHADGDCTEVE